MYIFLPCICLVLILNSRDLSFQLLLLLRSPSFPPRFPARLDSFGLLNWFPFIPMPQISPLLWVFWSALLLLFLLALPLVNGSPIPLKVSSPVSRSSSFLYLW